MMQRIWVFTLTGLLLGWTVQSQAHTVQYRFFLNGAAEVPAVDTPGIGTALVTFDLDLVTMRVQAEFSGLKANTTASHIHCCDFLPNTNAGVATESPSFTGFPLGVTAGTMDHTFDMTLAGSYRAQFITDNGGTVGDALNALLADLATGKAYFNIHTTAHPPGEIRGQAIFVPEPGTIALALLGLALAMSPRQWRRC